ncbi:MAG: hypothetical protein WCL57_06165 [Chloroflexota bacterium]|jgi:hypothetical protein
MPPALGVAFVFKQQTNIGFATGYGVGAKGEIGKMLLEFVIHEAGLHVFEDARLSKPITSGGAKCRMSSRAWL